MIYQKYTGEVKIKNKGGINLTINKDNLIKKQQEEIERLQEENTILKQTMCNNSLLINENVLLKSIIKEVREYIEEHSEMTDLQIYGIENILAFRGSCKKLLEILDKAEKENDIEFDVLKALNTDLDDDVEMG